jgi:hypothetical protein
VRTIGSSAIGLLALSGCGSGNSGGPTGTTPPPLPAATRAFVHVLLPAAKVQEPASLSTFEVAVPGGQLRLLATRPITGASGAAADPAGRFLYVGGATNKRVEYLPAAGYVQSYQVDGPSGDLTPGNQTLGPSLGGCEPPTCRPVPLAATVQEVFVYPGCADWYEGFFVFQVDRSSGTLTRVSPGRAFWDLDSESRWAVPLPSTPIVYADVDGREVGIFSSRGDGTLDLVDTVPTPGGTQWYSGGAYEAVLTDGCLVASWRNGSTGASGIVSYRIDPATGLLAAGDSLPGFVPLHLAGAAGGRVAVTTAGTLVPLVLTDTCRIQSRDAVPIMLASTGSYAGSVAFHPSGRFVYVDQDTGLQVYVVLDSGSLQLIDTQPGARGRVIVASPPS